MLSSVKMLPGESTVQPGHRTINTALSYQQLNRMPRVTIEIASAENKTLEAHCVANHLFLGLIKTKYSSKF